MRIVADVTAEKNVIALEIIEDKSLHRRHLQHLVNVVDDLVSFNALVDLDPVRSALEMKMDDFRVLGGEWHHVVFGSVF